MIFLNQQIFFKWSIEQLIRQVCLLFFLLLLLSGCCQKPWAAFDMPTSPDRSCRTGTTHGYDVYIWNCINNQKVVIYQYSSEMTCQKPQKEITTCGQLTDLEKKLSSTLQKGCQKLPEFRQWP